MKDVSYNIIVENDQVKYTQNTATCFQDLVLTMLTILEGNAQYIIQRAKAEITEDPNAEQIAKDTLFDLLNMAYSSSLSRIDPEGDLHPTLTEKAIREAEDGIIMDGRLNEVKKGS